MTKKYLVFTEGYASDTYAGRIASAANAVARDYNRALSDRRAKNAWLYLYEACAAQGNLPVDDKGGTGKGFERNTVSGELPEARSVRVTVQRPGLPQPTPVRIPKPADPRVSQSRIRPTKWWDKAMAPLGRLPVSVGDTRVEFQILDVIDNTVTKYCFITSLVGLAVPLGSVLDKLRPGAPEYKSYWTDFRTVVRCTPWDFVGSGSLMIPPGVSGEPSRVYFTEERLILKSGGGVVGRLGVALRDNVRNLLEFGAITSPAGGYIEVIEPPKQYSGEGPGAMSK